MFSFKVRGKDKLFAALKRSVPAVDVEVRKALEDGGDEMVEKARQLVPYREGDLFDSIEWRWTKKTTASGKRSPAIVVMAGAENESDPAFHVRFVEFGTVDAPKQPFFFPAYRLLRRKMRSRISRAMSRAIKKAGLGR